MSGIDSRGPASAYSSASRARVILLNLRNGHAQAVQFAPLVKGDVRDSLGRGSLAAMRGAVIALRRRFIQDTARALRDDQGRGGLTRRPYHDLSPSG